MTAIGSAVGAPAAGVTGGRRHRCGYRDDAGCRRRRAAQAGAAVAGLVAIALVIGLVNPAAGMVVVAALITGILNTAAGGGAVVSFVVLTALGVPPLTAHLCGQLITPAPFVASCGQLRQFWPGWPLLAAGCAGTLIGVGMLVVAAPQTVQAVAPAVLIAAAVVVAVQQPLTNRITRVTASVSRPATYGWTIACGLYAGTVGIGTGALALVVLGLAPGLTGMPLATLLRTRNVVLLGMALVVAAAITVTDLLTPTAVDWALVALLAAPAALGGWLGTRLVTHLPVPVLRAGLVATAVTTAAVMALR